MKNIVLLGPPGSGKGTQCARLVDKYGYIAISTGLILRDLVTKDTEFAKKIKNEIEKGNLVSDDIILELLSNKIDSYMNKDIKGFIFDGFPRNINQAYDLAALLKRKGLVLDRVIEIKVDKDILIKRISGRFVCANCSESYNSFFKPTKIKNVCDVCKESKFIYRKDDNEETIANRLEIFENLISPIISYYNDANILKTIDGMLDINMVEDAIDAAL